jgi:hypothetical protein
VNSVEKLIPDWLERARDCEEQGAVISAGCLLHHANELEQALAAETCITRRRQRLARSKGASEK